MGNMILDGIQSLRGINSWIGIIDSNVEGTHRVSYKYTRPSITDGIVRTGDPNQLALPKIPPTSFVITSTSLDWAQGEIIPSFSNVHFALNGRGFFVVVDQYGRPYLTRDGEFHWTSDGYLVNSHGLRVIGKGQNFIRRGDLDVSDDFTPLGKSLDFNTYGNKTLMVVDVANPDGLRFSQYGATVFILDGLLPFPIENDFNGDTLDGLNPFPNPGAFSLNVTPGRVQASGNTRALIGEATPISNFYFAIDLQVTGPVGVGDWVGLMFGQKSMEEDYNSVPAYGYSVRLVNTGAGTTGWELQLWENYNVATGAPLMIVSKPNVPDPTTGLRKLIVNVENEYIDVTIDNTNFIYSGELLINAIHEGYVSIRNTTTTEYDNLVLIPYRRYSEERTGKFWGYDVYKGNSAERKIAMCAEDFGTIVVRQALEQSNSPLTEFIPLLAVAQKMFTAISKIISVYNGQQDDLNGLIR